MATLILQAAGAFLGGFFGATGAAIAGAAGSMTGYLLDRALINSTLHHKGPRLKAMRPFTAEEGAPIPRIYGTMRVGGTLIWATRFEEKRRSRRQGIKGGPKVTTFTYFANAAFGLCEGPIAGVRRIWADGREIDRTQVDIRIYNGGPDQTPDTLIEAKQGDAPAYRGVAYVVVEHFALDDFGNRLPQFQFEVIRPVGGFGERIRAVTLIPGATEHGLATGLLSFGDERGVSDTKNRHVLFAESDLDASLDELAMLCPNLRHVALVVTWFGDDLRAGECSIYPAVVDNSAAPGWSVAGQTAETARAVSRHGGSAAYGGTPSDASVKQAIAAIKARGWDVTLYPFVMMDVPAGNELPDPYGGEAQAAYPWRGRITCFPGPGETGSADVTAAARMQVGHFCGQAEAADFGIDGGEVVCSGDPGDWGYRRMVLHYAHLAVAAGGVDAFLVGSELRGLTTLRDEANAFPFVGQLVDLAGGARGVLGGDAKLTYGADWSEYFGHHPRDGSGDVFFHLDPLWASVHIDAVGIDNYMPLADWRDEDVAGGNPDRFASAYDRDGMRGAITSGEGFDWYYASSAERLARERTPITDGLAGKPWVFRHKDIAGWWANHHVERVGGVELPAPTLWIPRSKPIWFTELGCAAVDKGPNQPNVFPDQKSSENALPYFSSGGRFDTAQRWFLEAHFDHWDAEAETFESAGNPVSPVYGGRMVDAERIYCWAWDARPFPAFPLLRDVWADGENWLFGHWLNGRAGAPGVGDLIKAILVDHGITNARCEAVEGVVQGYVVGEPGTARQALSSLIELFDLSVGETDGALEFRVIGHEAGEPAQVVDPVAADDRRAAIERTRQPEQELPSEVTIDFADPMNDYQAGSARSFDAGAATLVAARLDFPGAMEVGQAEALAADWLRRARDGRETIKFATPAADRGPKPGRLVQLPGRLDGDYLVTAVEEGLLRTFEARRLVRMPASPDRARLPAKIGAGPFIPGKPLVIFIDLPSVEAGPPQDRFRVAAFARPWKSQQVFTSPGVSAFAPRATILQPATIGRLAEPLGAGFEGRIDHAGRIDIEMQHDELASVETLQLLNGANVAAIRSVIGAWEIVQFAGAEEVEPGRWRLTELLRGQLGTGDAAEAGAAPGADFVVLDEAVIPAGLTASEIGMPVTWKVGPSGYDLTGDYFVQSEQVGGVRAQLPLSPAHLRATPAEDGAFAFNWIRRGRVDADSWLGDDIPLGEAYERYVLRIAPAGGDPVREITLGEPFWTYPATAVDDDFPVRPADVEVTVRQVSQAVGEGLAASLMFTIT